MDTLIDECTQKKVAKSSNFFIWVYLSVLPCITFNRENKIHRINIRVDPDQYQSPHQNDTDPQHCLMDCKMTIQLSKKRLNSRELGSEARKPFKKICTLGVLSVEMGGSLVESANTAFT